MAKLLSILLQRNDPDYSWGFTVRGGREMSTPFVIDQVTLGTMASQYLAPGDSILQINKKDAQSLTEAQVDTLVSRPSNSLDLLILKGDGVVSPYQPSSKFTFSRSVGSPDSATSQTSTGYVSSDSGTAGSSTNLHRLQSLKDKFWKRISDERSDFRNCEFDRDFEYQHHNNDTPLRQEQRRRCQSEDKTDFRKEEMRSSFFSDKDKSYHRYDPGRIHSIWSPVPSDMFSTPNSDHWPRDGHATDAQHLREKSSRQDSSEKQTSTRSESFNTTYKRHNSDYQYNTSASESSTTPSNKYSEYPSKFKDSFAKRASDLWSEFDRDRPVRSRLTDLKSPPFKLENSWKNTNISSKSEFKKSVSIKEQSYSSTEGPKSSETYEHMNKTKETEKSCKSVGGGKEETVEKTVKNKELIFENKEDGDGQPKGIKKVINDQKIIEKRVCGENEYCNKTKERSEEVTDSSTPVNFYDNVRQDVAETNVKTHPSVSAATSEYSESGNFKGESRGVNMCLPNSARAELPENKGTGFDERPMQEDISEVDVRSPLDDALMTKEDILRRQSSQLSGGGSPAPVSPQGDTFVSPSGPPAPPPPPPGLTGSIPSVRLSTQIPDKRQSAYEPPAAIQNAMMTKDKKPFTYTPGGLDLSEIRSPRMARRINRNANTPDTNPVQPRLSQPQQPLPPSAVAAMQPQIAVSVLPPVGGMPNLQHVMPGGHSAPTPPPPPPQPKTFPPVQNVPSPPLQPTSPERFMNRQPSPPPMSTLQLQPQHRHTKSEPQTTAGSIYVPPLQPRAQLGSLYIPPIEPSTPPVSQLNKAPTPWMSRQPQQQVQQEVPSWVHKENVQSPLSQQQDYQQPQTRVIPIQVEGKEPSQLNTRIIPIKLEGTPSPQTTIQQPNYQQQQQFPQQQIHYQQQQQQPQYQQQQFYGEQQNQGQHTPRWMNQQPVYVHNKFNSGSQSPSTHVQGNAEVQPSWRHSQSNGTHQSQSPVQSQSFRVLQKITGTENDGLDQNDGTYNTQGVPTNQLRKLQLSDDDRALMDKVKSQVDDEKYLHNESDPRYRGSSIPSRSFRILQSMTDGSKDDFDVPGGYSPVQAGQNRSTAIRGQQANEVPQQYVPPSEQQVPEPRKYTGGAIPSRSFRMLQAMTAGPDSPDRPGESEY